MGALIARTAGREPDPELVDEVHRRTGGNPFFVEQTARLWHSRRRRSSTIPPGVREAVRRRLALLPAAGRRSCSPPPPCWAASSTASCSRPPRRPRSPRSDRLLDQAVTARLVTALGAGRFAFAHDLVRETLYDALDDDRAAPPARRCGPGGRARAARPRSRTGSSRPSWPATPTWPATSCRRPAWWTTSWPPPATPASRLASEEAVGHRRRALERARALDPYHRVRERAGARPGPGPRR